MLFVNRLYPYCFLYWTLFIICLARFLIYDDAFISVSLIRLTCHGAGTGVFTDYSIPTITEHLAHSKHSAKFVE